MPWLQKFLHFLKIHVTPTLAQASKINKVQHSNEEDKIIESARAGSHVAFELLVNRYKAYVFTLVRRYINNREVAEELSQDVFLKAYRSLSGFEGRSRFSTWLYTIVNTTCISYLRRNRNNNLLPGDEALQKMSDNNSEYSDAGADLDQRTRAQALERALLRMAAEERQILTLFYQSEQSVNEIAAITGLSVSNVKVKLFRGRQKLKEMLTGTYNDYLA